MDADVPILRRFDVGAEVVYDHSEADIVVGCAYCFPPTAEKDPARVPGDAV